MRAFQHVQIHILLIGAIYLILPLRSVSQTCLPNGITFSQQYQIDNFSQSYPGCIHILGRVNIDGSTNHSITDLEGLHGLQQIGGELKIYSNHALTSLSGLDQVNSVGGSLTISANISLVPLDALSQLDYLGGGLYLSGNSALSDISIFGGLSEINGDLSLSSCNALESLNGLQGIGSVAGNLRVSFCDGLSNLSHLSGLEYVGGDVVIMYCDGLTSLDGLQGLTETGGKIQIDNNHQLFQLSGLDFLSIVGTHLTIEDCGQLTTLSHLNNLTSISGLLSVYNCDQLTSLSGLDNINYTGISSLNIRQSANLSDCAVRSICDFLDNGGAGQATISNNTTGCNSWGQVDDACQTLPVQWLYFVPVEKYPGIELLWGVAGNHYTDHFIIKQSTDGTDFHPIGKIYPTCNKKDQSHYRFLHGKPASGINYYYIQQENQDGSSIISGIQQVVYNYTLTGVYPNPTEGTLWLRGIKDQEVKLIRITDSSGRDISDLIKMDDRIVDLSGQADGLYFLTFFDSHQPIVIPVLKMQ